jgi:hypothetical protein
MCEGFLFGKVHRNYKCIWNIVLHVMLKYIELTPIDIMVKYIQPKSCPANKPDLIQLHLCVGVCCMFQNANMDDV